MKAMGWTGALALMLTACGGGAGGGNATDTSGVVAASGWKATDACAIMSRPTVAKTLGTAVATAELQAVKDGSVGNGDVYSQCTFTLADGRMLVFGTAAAAGSPDVAGVVASLRGQMGIVTNERPVELPGVGKAALWLPQMHALYVALGDGRWASATLAGFGKAAAITSDAAQADSIKLMRTIGA